MVGSMTSPAHQRGFFYLRPYEETSTPSFPARLHLPSLRPVRVPGRGWGFGGPERPEGPPPEARRVRDPGQPPGPHVPTEAHPRR